MENNNYLETVAARLGQNGSVKNVFGEPISTQGKTIIPVAQIAMGMGGGYGQKHGRPQKTSTANEEQPSNKDEGAGGGGGMYATAKGVYEITDKCTRFVPANSTRKFLLISTIAFFIGRWAGRRKLRKSLYKGLKA